MNKIKLALVAIAIVTGVGGAFASKPAKDICESAPQYYYTGSTYVLAGTYGVHYACWSMPGTCTYYKPDPINQPGLYLPCRPGVIQRFN
jgi:hypothetical protein